MRKWRCTICNYIHEGDAPPAKCPICGAPASKFVEVEQEVDKKATLDSKGAQEKAAKENQGQDTDTEPEIEESNSFLTDFILKHHLHPLSVHLPNGVLPIAVILFVLSVVFDSKTLATAGFINIVFVFLGLPFVLYAGYLEWEKRYRKAMTPVFQVKILSASMTYVLCFISMVWYSIDCDVLTSSYCGLFIFINLLMLTSAGIAGFIGGKLVFKD